MLTPEQIVAMTGEQLLAAKAAGTARAKLNRECQCFAAGVKTKRTRGGSKIRARRVAKTDWSRLRKLEDQERDIRAELYLLDEEMKRRAHAEKERA
ncbi:hypothetical protein ACQCLI_05005 [Pseudomonas nitroreducens]|uniref:hypothetical protein n=1 Tax=Pseudomonas nitroreducens TaxID=46680 RepID=UPI0002E78A8F|nr:hypothetical protein [Pseudomonas nitroreducens]